MFMSEKGRTRVEGRETWGVLDGLSMEKAGIGGRVCGEKLDIS
jgi:hypothetical protein